MRDSCNIAGRPANGYSRHSIAVLQELYVAKSASKQMQKLEEANNNTNKQKSRTKEKLETT